MWNAGLAPHRSKLQQSAAELIFTTVCTQINHNLKLVFLLAITHKLSLTAVGFLIPKAGEFTGLFFFSDYITFDADILYSRSGKIWWSSNRCFIIVFLRTYLRIVAVME